MPMNNRLLVPRQTLHPEAVAWRAAVIANGGTVSGATMNAVSRFCRSIDAAGIRDRFYRLNLFAGSGLTAALVPLYRGPVFGGATFGNATDTNNGPFVSGDYTEATALGGGATKWLGTGLAANFVAKRHLSVTVQQNSADVFRRVIGIEPDPSNFFDIFSITGSSPAGTFYGLAADAAALRNTGAVTNYASAAGDLLALSVVGTTATFYANASATANATTVSDPASTREIAVFSARTAAGALTATTSRLSSYSIGVGLTAAQVNTYQAIIRPFLTSIGRAGS